MVKAYIILAHTNPEQLLRLIKTLNDNKSCFFVHIDKSIDIERFKNLDELGGSLFYVDRVHSKWSSYELVQCTLNALGTIKKTNINFGRIILLSGQDYPIKSNAFIDKFFSESQYSIFFEYFSLPNHQKWPENNGGMYRVNKYFFGLKKHQLFFSKSINFLGKLLPSLQRKIVLEMKPFAGSQWWIIDMYTLDYILEFLNKHPEYINFHKYTFASDELFFQMILLNCKDERILDKIENDNKRLMKWLNPLASHPEILKTDDLDEIATSKNLFARKFDEKCDTAILDLIDKTCLGID